MHGPDEGVGEQPLKEAFPHLRASPPASSCSSTCRASAVLSSVRAATTCFIAETDRSNL